MDGKIAVVTGAAQGFGKGIAEGLVRAGAWVAIADMNLTGAQAAADYLNANLSTPMAMAFGVDVTVESSVEALVKDVESCAGGIDLFVANAGVVKSGSILEMDEKDFRFVNDVNYYGFYLCAKHAARLMAAQSNGAAQAGEEVWTDIVQVSSKSGLLGSNRNAAYAGSKFGGIGLVQSLALELVEHRIKVNAVCPGNYFDGPLWSHPEQGLFKQYLDVGKVPGAETVMDVRDFYESKIPMKRSCTPEDVSKAILYFVDQKYETGQALPVSGGQIMLK